MFDGSSETRIAGNHELSTAGLKFRILLGEGRAPSGSVRRGEAEDLVKRASSRLRFSIRRMGVPSVSQTARAGRQPIRLLRAMSPRDSPWQSPCHSAPREVA